MSGMGEVAKKLFDLKNEKAEHNKCVKELNVEIKEVDNKEAIEIASKVSKETKESTGYGFIYQENGVSKIVINKDEVATDGILNTGAHEFLHFALKNI